MSKCRYRRPARWARVIGLGGQPPSREALLAASQMTALPPALWHVEADDAAFLSHARAADATHQASGEPFTLAYAGDRIVAFATQSAAAIDVVPWGQQHLGQWANQQRWRIAPPVTHR